MAVAISRPLSLVCLPTNELLNSFRFQSYCFRRPSECRHVVFIINTSPQRLRNCNSVISNCVSILCGIGIGFANSPCRRNEDESGVTTLAELYQAANERGVPSSYCKSNIDS